MQTRHTTVHVTEQAAQRAYETHVARNMSQKPWQDLSDPVKAHWHDVVTAVVAEVRGDAE